MIFLNWTNKCHFGESLTRVFECLHFYLLHRSISVVQEFPVDNRFTKYNSTENNSQVSSFIYFFSREYLRNLAQHPRCFRLTKRDKWWTSVRVFAGSKHIMVPALQFPKVTLGCGWRVLGIKLAPTLTPSPTKKIHYCLHKVHLVWTGHSSV